MIEALFTSVTIFSAIPGFDLVDIITGLGVLAVLFVIFAESGLLIGFFLPGDSLLFTAGVLTHSGIFNINIHLFVLLLFIAAVAGDSVGYTFGRRVGHRIFKRPESFLFRQENIKHAEAFYEKHGGKTIIIARFVPVVRTFAPVIAGVAKMKYKTFLSYNLIGGLLWTASITYLGYFLGVLFEQMNIKIDTVIYPIIAIIIAASILPPAIHIFKDRKRRQATYSSIKLLINKLLRRK
jgi:membrane-associated protein